MALQGTIRFYEWQEDLTAEPEIIENVQIPDNLPEGHAQYENRGQIVTVTEYPQVEVLVQEEKDIYVVIEMCALHLIDFIRDHENAIDPKHFNVQYKFNVYMDKETRLNNLYDRMMEIEGDTVHIDNISEEDLNNKNLLAYCYDHLKQRRGCEDLVDA
jgi:hypothetical protein